MQQIKNTTNPSDQARNFDFEDPGQFLEEAAEALHIVSPQGIIVWANKRELELLGYSKEEYIGHHITEFYSDRFVINDILCRLVNKQEVVNYPAELKKKDGSKIHVLLNSNVYFKDGDFIHARSSTRDVNDLKLFQTRLENSNARVLNQLLSANTLINLITSCSWKTDYQGHITTLQPKWQEYTGQDFDEQLDYGWLKAIHPDDRITLKSNLITSLKENRDLHQLARVYNKRHKTYIYCGIYASPLLDMHDHNFEWTFILVDQTRVVNNDVLPIPL